MEELLAFAHLLFQRSLLDEPAAALYRSLVLPLLFALFTALSDLPGVVAYQQRLSGEAQEKLLPSAAVSDALEGTALLTATAALAVALIASPLPPPTASTTPSPQSKSLAPLSEGRQRVLEACEGPPVGRLLLRLVDLRLPSRPPDQSVKDPAAQRAPSSPALADCSPCLLPVRALRLFSGRQRVVRRCRGVGDYPLHSLAPPRRPMGCHHVAVSSSH